MNKAETIDQIARSADITKTAAAKILKALETSIKAHSDAGQRIQLNGLGSFSRGEAAQRTGRNPQTGAPLTYTGYRRRTGTTLFSESKLHSEIASATGMEAQAVRRAVDAFKGVCKSILRKGGALTLIGFGNFYVGNRAARSGRNPQTGASIRIAAAKVPKFRTSKTGNRGGKFSAAKGLKDALN